MKWPMTTYLWSGLLQNRRLIRTQYRLIASKYYLKKDNLLLYLQTLEIIMISKHLLKESKDQCYIHQLQDLKMPKIVKA